MIQLFLFVIGNLAGSFFCSLSEAALLSASEARIRVRVARGERGARRLLALRRDPGPTLASVVFLNNVFAIGGTAAITAAATQVIATGMGMFLFICAQTFLIIAFGEIVPKVLGEARPETISMRVAPVLVWVRFLLRPLVQLVNLVVGWARPRSRVLAGEEEEIRALARLGQEAGHIAPEDVELIRRVFRLDDIRAEDVMTPRALVRAFGADATLADVQDELMTVSHGQFPVYEEDLDTVTGVLHLRDALRAIARGETDRTVGEIARPALFLPTSKTVDDVLRDLQMGHGRMAIVIDEYGVTEGVITMDDLVEELVGEAIDATDVSEGLVKRLSRTEALVHGLNRVRDVARFLNCGVTFANPEEENTTITGLLQERLERIPERGDRIELPPGLLLEVQEADARAAVRVLARNTMRAADRKA